MNNFIAVNKNELLTLSKKPYILHLAGVNKQNRINISTTYMNKLINNMIKGSWINSARNIKFKNNLLQCELNKIDGTWEKNELIVSTEYEYHNINGRLQWGI